VSPNGHTLVTWITEDGVQARLDSEPYGTIAYAAGPGSLHPLVTDAAAARVVFGARGGRVFVVERPAGSGWQPPRLISGSLGATEGGDPLAALGGKPRRPAVVRARRDHKAHGRDAMAEGCSC
jgi:hypothetical protein